MDAKPMGYDIKQLIEKPEEELICIICQSILTSI